MYLDFDFLRLPYLTSLDKYILFTVGLVVIVGIQTILPRAVEFGSDYDYNTFSWTCLNVDFFIWFCFQFYNVVGAYFKLEAEVYDLLLHILIKYAS